MAKKFYKIIKKEKDPFINDSNDHIFNQEEGPKYAIVGNNRSSCKFIIRVLN